MENLSSYKHSYPIPNNYEFIKVLGKGSYGTVIKCIKCDSSEEVAVKIDNDGQNFYMIKEANIMKKLMKRNLEKFNIIKYNGELLVNSAVSLEFESLDISLLDYIGGLKEWMPREEIRSVIQQMAMAFEALKRMKVIHTDVKSDNILLVDRIKRPLRVKLIDFGLAISNKVANQGMSIQAQSYRAPEIILGLPFSESIDIWALGIVMAYMMFDTLLFPGNDEYQTLQYMVELLGPPPEHLLNAAWASQEYFKETTGGSRILMTPEEFYGCDRDLEDKRQYTFRSLEEVKKKHKRKGAEWTECIELLKAMLQWNEQDRITPRHILEHPFITKSYLKSKSSIEPSLSQTEDEDIKKKDEELMIKDKEIKRKGEEVMRKDVEIKRKEKIKKKDEEIKRKETEKKDKEIKRKDEEILRKDEQIKRQEGELKRKKESEKKDEEIKRKEETGKKNEEIIVKDEEIKRTEIEKKDEEIKRKDEQIKMDEEMNEDEEIKIRDEEIQKKDEEIKKGEEIKEKNDEIRKMDFCFSRLRSWIRKNVPDAAAQLNLPQNCTKRP